VCLSNQLHEQFFPLPCVDPTADIEYDKGEQNCNRHRYPGRVTGNEITVQFDHIEGLCKGFFHRHYFEVWITQNSQTNKTIPNYGGFFYFWSIQTTTRNLTAYQKIRILTVLAFAVIFLLGANEKSVYKFGLTAHGPVMPLITHVFVHNGMEHLLGNLYFFLPIATFMFLSKGIKTFFLMLIITLMQGAMVWAFGKPGMVYAGSSGLAYGCGFYVLTKGLLSMDRRYMLFSAAFLTIYFPVFCSFMDTGDGLSDISHVAGTLSGLLLSISNYVLRPSRAH
jgi:membrane associated rhomboid family serine protease